MLLLALLEIVFALNGHHHSNNHVASLSFRIGNPYLLIQTMRKMHFIYTPQTLLSNVDFGRKRGLCFIFFAPSSVANA